MGLVLPPLIGNSYAIGDMLIEKNTYESWLSKYASPAVSQSIKIPLDTKWPSNQIPIFFEFDPALNLTEADKATARKEDAFWPLPH